MARNMGNLDRGLRLVVAVVALIVGIVIGAGSVGGIVLIVIAAIMGGTSLVGFCPLYPLLRVNTCPRKPTAGA
ncbi:MAG: DUF2892 domain-containing protein [Thermoleophilia bacterium]